MSVKRSLLLGSLLLAALGCEEMRHPASGNESPSNSVLTAVPVGVPVYNVTAINATTGLRLNQSGDVVGWTTKNGPTEPFLYTAQNGVIVLPTLTGQPYGVARDLSDRTAGVITVVGEAKLSSSGGAIHAVRWTVAVPQGNVLNTSDLGTLPGHSESAAYGVNNAGQIVGTSDPNSALSIRSFIYTNATGMVDLGLGSIGTNAVARDINASGVVTGYLGLKAFRWTTTGGLENLGTPAGWANSFGLAINASNQVAASATDAFGNASNVARYTNGIGWQALGGLGQSVSQGSNSGNGINQWGDVAGLGWPRTGVTPAIKAVFYSDNLGVLAYVDDLLLVPGSWLIKNAFDINDAQQITGYATNVQSGVTSAVLLTPVNPPPPNQPPVPVWDIFCNGFFACGVGGGFSTDDYGIIWYSWSVNGQVVATGTFANIQFSGPQTANVTLTVTDTRGVSTSLTRPIVVGGPNHPPVAAYTYSCTGLVCSFDGRGSTDPDFNPLTYLWDFGDRAGDIAPAPSHTYLTSGTYTVTLTVTDYFGLTNTITKQVVVTGGGTNQPPVARWTYSCTTAHVCTFNGTTSTDPDGTIAAYNWKGPNGKVLATTATFIRTFTRAMTTSMTLTVTDNGGLSASRTKTVVVP